MAKRSLLMSCSVSWFPSRALIAAKLSCLSTHLSFLFLSVELHSIQEFNGPSCAYTADVNLLKVPSHLPDSKVLLLSDILPTAWHANELGGVGKGDRVAIWGAGPGECEYCSCTACTLSKHNPEPFLR